MKSFTYFLVSKSLKSYTGMGNLTKDKELKSVRKISNNEQEKKFAEKFTMVLKI